MAQDVRDNGVILGITRPTAILESGLAVEQFIVIFESALNKQGCHLQYVFPMGKDSEVEAIGTMDSFDEGRKGWVPSVLV